MGAGLPSAHVPLRPTGDHAHPRGRPQGTIHTDRGQRAASRQRRTAHAALAGRRGDGRVRAGLLLGCREGLLAAAGRHHHRRRVCRRLHPQPHLRGGLQRADRPRRGGARRLRPLAHQLRRSPACLLGAPRSDAGHATGQRPGHAVSLGHLLASPTPSARRPKPHGRPTRRSSAGPATGPSPPRSRRPGPSTMPSPTTSST